VLISGNHLYVSLSLLVTPDACWAQNGITVAGGHGEGDGLQQVWSPCGLVVDDDGTVFIADREGHRIVVWKKGDNQGHVVAGGQSAGNGLHQLFNPTDVLIDNETKSLIICDCENRRVVRWPLENGTKGEILVDNILCWGLTMDNQGCLYVSEHGNAEVRRFTRGDRKGIVVAGGNGQGDHLNQLNGPNYIFVDEEQSLYVSDHNNHRVMKWMKGATEGIVVAGGRGQGKELTQLSYPNGVWVDEMGTVYVAEHWNRRVTRWPKGESRGIVVLNGNATNQLQSPEGLSFDRRGNMYVADSNNNRVQKFKLEKN
jgi:sugar lactone lactonase YvrE